MLRRRPSPQSLLLLLLGAVALVALWKLFFQVLHEMRGSYHSDVGIYLAVGRGILNGLMPYRDLFETKPPGIFLLSALSLKLMGSAKLLLSIDALLIGLFPVWLMIPFLRDRSRLLISFLFGALLALYVAHMSGQGLSESFGVFFATGAVALWFLSHKRLSWPMAVLITLLIFLATGIKEPFVLSAIAGMIIVSPSWKSASRIAVPVAVAGVLGLIGLALLGSLHDYVGIYLHHMLGHQVFIPWGTADEPFLLRTVDLPRQWMMMQSFSVLFPWVITSLWIGALIILRKPWSRVLQWLIGTWLMTLAVGISGDFYGHQFIFAVPVYAAFFFVCFREELPLKVVSIWSALVSICLLLLPVASPTPGQDWKDYEAERTHAANVIDTVMDRCTIDRYLILINGNDGIYAYTKHSPYGPLFTQYARFIGGHPLFIQEFGRQFHTAPLAIDKDNEAHPLIDEQSRAEFETSFTEVPPACAGADFVQPVPYHLLFRVGSER